jgi:hypothetical protein
MHQPGDAGGSRKGLWIALGLIVVAALAGLGWKAFSDRAGGAGKTGALTERTGGPLNMGGLADRSGRVAPVAPIATGRAPAPADPTAIIDYIAFLKQIETARIQLQKKQLGELLAKSGSMTQAGVIGELNGNGMENQARAAYTDFQNTLQRWTLDWQTLSRQFMSKTPPNACKNLAEKYYDLLGKTAGAINGVGNSFAQAMSGDPSKALEALSGMKGGGMGSPSKAVADACVSADEELGAVCGKFRIRKDFDIKDDGGGGNLFGGL